MTSGTETFQISERQAEIYESKFVPAIFAQWSGLLVDAADVGPGDSVLDVACGTGVFARAAAARVGPTGTVKGIDLSEGMLTVARRLRPDLDWRRGDAEDLPFEDASFDAVVCQSGLMFFSDVTAALREMRRVARPEGRIAVQVYASLEDQPGYGPWVQMVARHAGPDAIRLLSTYWSLGDLDTLCSRFAAAGLHDPVVRTGTGTARFGSIEDMVRTEIDATPLVDRIGDAVYRDIITESAQVLRPFRTADGLDLPIVAHILSATRP